MSCVAPHSVASSWGSGSKRRFVPPYQPVDSKERLQSFRSARDLAEQLRWIGHGYRLLGLDETTSDNKVIETSCTINGNSLFQKARKCGEVRGRLLAAHGERY
jgi:hypothetical protein